jgi:endonuclease/exonuclease/phosphatase (EEP) superfamily protein YafD
VATPLFLNIQIMDTPTTDSLAPSPARAHPLRASFTAAFWTLTALALPAALLTTAAYFSSRPAFLAQLSPFRAQYAALLGAHVAICLLLRRPRWAALFALFALFNLWAVRPATPDSVVSIDAGAPPLKILLVNVLTSNPDPGPLLELVRAEKPDLVALLEINHRWQAELTRAPALLADYPHHRFHPREDNFGLAVFSRRPLADLRLEFLADPDLPSLAFTLPLGARPLHVLLTHPLPPGTAAGTALRDLQLDRIAQHDRSLPAGDPRLVLGDLNATPWCPPLRRLLAQTGLRPASFDRRFFAPTWPAPAPLFLIPIDHALIDARLVCTDYRVGPDIGSDHLPVLLDLFHSAPPSATR